MLTQRCDYAHAVKVSIFTSQSSSLQELMTEESAFENAGASMNTGFIGRRVFEADNEIVLHTTHCAICQNTANILKPVEQILSYACMLYVSFIRIRILLVETELYVQLTKQHPMLTPAILRANHSFDLDT